MRVVPPAGQYFCGTKDKWSDYWFTLEVGSMVPVGRVVADVLYGCKLTVSEMREALCAATEPVMRELADIVNDWHINSSHDGGLVRVHMRLQEFPTGWSWFGFDLSAAVIAEALGRHEVALYVCGLMRAALSAPQAP